MYSPNFQPILDAALDSYTKRTGIDLTKHPSADKLQNCRSPDDVLKILSERESAFKDHRDKYRNLIDRVRPVVQVVHALSAVLGEIAGLVSSGIGFVSSSRILTPPNRCHSIQRKRYLLASTFFSRCVSPVFSVRSIYDTPLRQAAIGVSASYDALADLFECVSNFLRRFQIYAEKVSLSPAMSDITVKIMIEVLSVLALATKQINQGRFSKWYWHTAIQFSPFERATVKFAKKLIRESDVEAVLQRLDRLTQEEARVASAHTLEVVHGLFDTLRVVMDGVSILLRCPSSD
jgi:hypothetical protein